jgi:hypothetical protein
VPDHLNLSLWLRNTSPLLATSTLKKVLEEFPFSKFRPEATLRVLALDFGEPPLLERVYDDAADPEDMAEASRQFLHEDSGFQVEAYWDLWQWDGDWSLKPSQVLIEIYCPEFSSPTGEQVKIDVGPEDLYLPSEDAPGVRQIQANVRSVLQLLRDLEGVLALENRLLWSDSGEDFIEKLEDLA